MSKSDRSLCVSFSQTDAGLYIYSLFVRSNLNFLHISKWITLITQSCLVLYSSCANLLHSLIVSWWFLLYLYITYICYFVASYLFSLWWYYYYYYYYYYYFYYYITPLEFFIPALSDGYALVFGWPQVFKALPSILVNLNKAVVLMITTCPNLSVPFKIIWW